MALEEFENDEEPKKRPRPNTTGTRHYVMGALWIVMGLYLLLPVKWGYQYMHGNNDSLIMVFGAVSVLYGSYRIYRGYKKQD